MSASGGDPKLPVHPYLCGDSLPTSEQQPALTATVRYFTINREKLVSDYPYEISPSAGKKVHVEVFRIPYCEISGLGPPPADLRNSHLGDIYVDLSPAQYAVYGRVADGTWKRWYDPQPFHKTEAAIVKHPHFRHRLLWCSDAVGISWFVSTTVHSNQERAKLKGLVSADVDKTEETKWREAAAIIGIALGREGWQREWREGTARAGGDLAPLGDTVIERVVRGAARSREAQDAQSEGTRTELEDEKPALKEEICVLEKQLECAAQLVVAVEPKQFSEWMEKVVSDGIATARNKMDPKVREYWDLRTELAAGEEQLCKEETLLEDVQVALGLAISEHKQLKLSAGV
ncbi:hypothetical protein B0H14DRAFT_3475737 [Mycena olivaceomarginata]|nr:hypothetical protein B0H14DRAFT_3475737 [Mycena olivaceomarginata]